MLLRPRFFRRLSATHQLSPLSFPSSPLSLRQVRAARAAARAQLDAEEEEERHRGRGKAGRNKKRPGREGAGGGSRESRNNRRSGSDGAGAGAGGLEGATTADDVLELRWPVDVGAAASAADNGSPDDDSREHGGAGEEGRGTNQEGKGGETKSVPMLSLKTYVKQRQAGGGGVASKGGGGAGVALQTEEKKAEELRKTALLGPVLNDGDRCARGYGGMNAFCVVCVSDAP